MIDIQNVKACGTKSLVALNLREWEHKVTFSLPNIENNMTGTNNRNQDNSLKMIILG